MYIYIQTCIYIDTYVHIPYSSLWVGVFLMQILILSRSCSCGQEYSFVVSFLHCDEYLLPVCVCMYVRMYVCMYAFVVSCLHCDGYLLPVCTYVCMYVCMHLLCHAYTAMGISGLCMYVCTYVCMYVCMKRLFVRAYITSKRINI